MKPVEDRSSLTTLSLDQALKQLGVDAVDGLRKKENGKKQKKIKHKNKKCNRSKDDDNHNRRKSDENKRE
jgi:hypothetical protein